jgi:hypothetical protein
MELVIRTLKIKLEGIENRMSSMLYRSYSFYLSCLLIPFKSRLPEYLKKIIWYRVVTQYPEYVKSVFLRNHGPWPAFLNSSPNWQTRSFFGRNWFKFPLTLSLIFHVHGLFINQEPASSMSWPRQLQLVGTQSQPIIGQLRIGREQHRENRRKLGFTFCMEIQTSPAVSNGIYFAKGLLYHDAFRSFSRPPPPLRYLAKSSNSAHGATCA